MKLTTKSALILSAITGLATSAHAIVNFESVGATDNTTVGIAQPFTDGGVTFEFGVDLTGAADGIVRTEEVFFEQTGNDTDSGFQYDQARPSEVFDTESPSAGSPGLGNYFLRTEPVGAGGNSLDGTGVFVIEFTAGTTFASSGQIWDIDGGGAGTEQYIVQAYDASSNAIGFADTSIIGSTNGSDTATSLDGLPWTFSVSSFTAIKYITIDFTGSKTTNIGLAFDNFNATAVPEPSTYALLSGMLALSAVMIRRRK